MKKIIFVLPGAIFPYTLLFALYCIFTGFLMESVFENNAFTLLFYLLVFFAVSLLGNLVFLILSIVRRWDAKKISFINMMVKLIQIPAYVLIFILGLIFMLTVFTYAFSIFFVLFDCLAIFLSGLTGVACVVRCYAEGKASKPFSIINGILQFFFCIDVVSAVVVFIKSKVSRAPKIDQTLGNT